MPALLLCLVSCVVDFDCVVVGVHSGLFWAPPFEGPLKLPAALIDEYFDAYTAYGQAIEELSEEYARACLVVCGH